MARLAYQGHYNRPVAREYYKAIVKAMPLNVRWIKCQIMAKNLADWELVFMVIFFTSLAIRNCR